MEMMFKITSKILMWIGWIALGAMAIAMLIFGFVGAMVAVAVLSVANGGDPSPIFLIIKVVSFMWQFACVMFLFSGLMWAFSLIAKSKKKEIELTRQKEFEEIKAEIYEALEDAQEFKKLKSRRRK